MEMIEVLIALLGGAGVAALINQIGEYVRARKDHEEDTEVEKDIIIDKINQDISDIKDGMRLLFLDRIKELGQSYIKDKEIDFDDRRILHQMHDFYHNKAEGNGDLDPLMAEINNLPLKVKD